MTVPGFTPSSTSWRSTVPGWTAPVVDPRLENDSITATLDGITVGTLRTDLADFRQLSTLEGWWNAPDVRAESMPKPDADGDHEGQVLLGPRPLHLGGLIVAPSRPVLLEEMERFGSILTAAPRFGTLVVTEQERGLARQCQVRRVQAPDVVPVSSRVAKWSWYLRAADPMRYSAEERQQVVQLGVDQPIQNAGTDPVPFLLDLRGPLTNPSFWIDGAQWRLNQTIPTGVTAIAYWSEREVFSGSTSLRFYQQGPWPLLKPGVTQVGLSAQSGTGSALVRWRHGWL